MNHHFPRKRQYCLKVQIFESFLINRICLNNAGYAGDVGLIPGSGRSPEGGNGNPLQYSCLENPMDRGDWRAIV